MKKRALVFGGSGLVGSQLLQLLGGSPLYKDVYAFVRRPLEGAPLSVIQITVPELSEEELGKHRELFGGSDVYCCLGTTIRIAKTQEAFRKVDYEYPLAIGRLCRSEGAAALLVISSMGANPASRVFYSRTKGEMERDLAALGLPALVLVRPSLLIGERKEFRLGEQAAAVVSRVLPFRLLGPLRKYAPIEASAVAAAMLHAAGEGRKGTVVLESEQLAQLAAKR
ncbi:oxidoreductase [Paenibacillus turpanensis]|uniref:oxidoreductase n=1 Tax=Paenibacillus turpanensis TaxID=2689078 RepID=UPI00140A3165|nr:oxidoreductase [Paenibacillus turpanensis]